MTIDGRRRAGLLLSLALAVLPLGLMTPGSSAPPPLHSMPAGSGYAGPCVGADAQTGVTVVVDFQQLDGNGGVAAPMLERCSPATLDADGQPEPRTGLEAMQDAGLATTGVVRWGDAFVCRINGRPSATEDIPVAGNPAYHEPCVDTPPASAYWSYWHADERGSTWTYSNYGVTNRNVTPGGFEGWSFALNATATTNPPPDLEPRNPALDQDAPVVSLSSDLLSPPLQLGQSTTLSWTTERVTSLVASGDWSGSLSVPSGTRRITPTEPGTLTYTVTGTSADGETVSDSYRLEVVGDASPTEPPSPTTSPTTSSTGTPTGTPSGTPTEPPTSTSTPTPTTGPSGPSDPPGTGIDPLADDVAGWLVGELDRGAMPAPIPTPSQPADWGLTVDTLWALYAAGTGEQASRQIVGALDRRAGDYLGVKLFRDASVRRAGQTAKVLVAAVVAGRDPRSFGRVMRSDGSLTDRRYDLRAETERLIATAGPSRGRLQDHGLGIDNTNVFSQSLAVIGLARSGGVSRAVVDYLLRQQCGAGYFRMFDRNAATCDADRDTPDGDGTAMGVQALMTARDHGMSGLDAAIDRGVDWLLRAQFADGSFGGGVGTEAANTNSTGLIAQTLAEAGETAAFRRARHYVAGLTVTPGNSGGTALAGEEGAVAYQRASFDQARRSGITGRDQWRRATAQAIFALAPVSFVHLGEQQPKGDPVPPPGGTPPSPPDPGSGPGAEPPSDAAGSDAPDPEDDEGEAVVRVPERVGLLQAPSPTPAGRLAYLLASRLVDGDHVEVSVGGRTYVDYDLTADIGLALRSLGEQRPLADRVSRFLLDPRSQAAYVDGTGYERRGAAYAEPLAKSLLVAATTPEGVLPTSDMAGRTGSTGRGVAVNDLGATLAGLVDASGDVVDRGRYADTSGSLTRQSLALVALTAAGQRAAADMAAARLLADACPEGGFPALATDEAPSESADAECRVDDETTGWATQALSASGAHTGVESEPAPADVSSRARADAVLAASRALTTGLSAAVVTPTDATVGAESAGAAAPVAAVRGDSPRPRSVSVMAAGRTAAGLTSPDAQSFLVAQQQPDGGLPGVAGLRRTDLATSATAAYGLTGRSLLDLPGAGLRAGVSVSLDERYQPATPSASQGGWLSTLPWLVVGLGALLLVFLLGRRSARARATVSTPVSAPAHDSPPER